MLCCSNTVRKLTNARERYAAPSRSSRIAIQTDLNEHSDVPTPGCGRTVEGDDELVPIDGMDRIDVGSQRAGFVGLQLTDEVDVKAVTDRLGQSADLGRRLLIAVLPDVRHTETAQQFDV
jgi:hypothetical protein